ncbi:DNA cytosine methyltransferase, partial [Salmonella enterica]|uniref:DNA cytosine methyltransferase n=1 Tax=Salmonella enterica TaxID=28901 RepID=UPI00398C474C
DDQAFSRRTQGTCDVAVYGIITDRRPESIVLYNVENLKRSDKGSTVRVIMKTLDELGDDVVDDADNGPDVPKIIDGQYILQMHGESMGLVGVRRA